MLGNGVMSSRWSIGSLWGSLLGILIGCLSHLRRFSLSWRSCRSKGFTVSAVAYSCDRWCSEMLSR